MNIVLLSGGSGKRLWPLSNDIRSKQFIKIFKKSDGGYESMLQRVYRQMKCVDPEASVTIATSRSQVSAIYNQLGQDVKISAEPCRRDTFAAIALAAAYLHDEQGISGNEMIVVCPVDPYVDDSYFECVGRIYRAAEQGRSNLVLMGIQPTYPSEKYGYIRPVPSVDGKPGYAFTEKPDKETALRYMEEGALWNGGIFACRISYILGKSRRLLGTDRYQELFDGYDRLKKISFDYAVAESETNLEIIKYSGKWKDLGTWNTLTEAMEEQIIGNGRMDEGCSNVHIINELDIPILGMALHDVVISASPEGILVSDKEHSSYIKPFVDEIDQQIMFAEKSWGSYRVLDVAERSMTVKVTLNPGNKMNYHSHEMRDEIWAVTDGDGRVIIDGTAKAVNVGSVITMAAGCRHTVIAGKNGLQLIEVQLGDEINVSDKLKYEMPLQVR